MGLRERIRQLERMVEGEVVAISQQDGTESGSPSTIWDRLSWTPSTALLAGRGYEGSLAKLPSTRYVRRLETLAIRSGGRVSTYRSAPKSMFVTFRSRGGAGRGSRAERGKVHCTADSAYGLVWWRETL